MHNQLTCIDFCVSNPFKLQVHIRTYLSLFWTWTMAQTLIVLHITNQCCSAQVCSWSVESASKIQQWQQESWAGQSLLWAVMWQPLLCHNAQLLMQLPSVDWKMKSEELVASCTSKDQMTGWWRGSSCVCSPYIVPIDLWAAERQKSSAELSAAVIWTGWNFLSAYTTLRFIPFSWDSFWF